MSEKTNPKPFKLLIESHVNKIKKVPEKNISLVLESDWGIKIFKVKNKLKIEAVIGDLKTGYEICDFLTNHRIINASDLEESLKKIQGHFSV